MSTTSIYRLGRDPTQIGETRNSWRGAMYIWNDVAKRYCGLDAFPMFCEAEQSRVWNANRHTRMPRHEAIVLMTTMDGAVIRGEDAKAVAEAFEQYASEHPAQTSFAEQAAILRSDDVQPGDLIGWQQTSVSEFWGVRWSDDGEEMTWYDPAKEDRHFDAYAAALKSETIEAA